MALISRFTNIQENTALISKIQEVEAKIKDILNFQSDRIILGAPEAPLPNETGINNKAMAKKIQWSIIPINRPYIAEILEVKAKIEDIFNFKGSQLPEN